MVTSAPLVLFTVDVLHVKISPNVVVKSGFRRASRSKDHAADRARQLIGVHAARGVSYFQLVDVVPAMASMCRLKTAPTSSALVGVGPAASATPAIVTFNDVLVTTSEVVSKPSCVELGSKYLDARRDRCVMIPISISV